VFGVLIFASLAALPGFSQSQQRGEELSRALPAATSSFMSQKMPSFLPRFDQPVEQGAPPPRVVDLDSQHIAILFGASEWRSLTDPKPIRLTEMSSAFLDAIPIMPAPTTETQIPIWKLSGSISREASPAVSQLRRKIDFPADPALFLRWL